MMQLGLFATPNTAPTASGGYPCDVWQVHAAGIWREGACTPETGTRIDGDDVARWLIEAALDSESTDGSRRWEPGQLVAGGVMAAGRLVQVDPGFRPALEGELRVEFVAVEAMPGTAGMATRVQAWRGDRLVAVVMALAGDPPATDRPKTATSPAPVTTAQPQTVAPTDWRESHIMPKTHRFVLAWTIVSKWLIVQHVLSDVVIAEKVCVCAISSYKAFAVYQSCAHVCWARFSGLHSTMNSTARYLPSRIFATMPRPRPSDGGYALEEMGKLYAEQRYVLYARLKIGGTTLYNRLADPAEKDPAILAMRTTAHRMDQMVLDSYGWGDLTAPTLDEVPPCQEVGATPPVFFELTRRLRALNLERAREQSL